jgi:hypothetical protein
MSLVAQSTSSFAMLAIVHEDAGGGWQRQGPMGLAPEMVVGGSSQPCFAEMALI